LICVEDINLKYLDFNGRYAGRRTPSSASAKSGRYVKAQPVRAGEGPFDVAVDATVRAALNRTGRRSASDPIAIDPADLRKKCFKRPRTALMLFVVDASDSMGQGTYARMKAAKGAVLAMLTQAQVRRHRVGMVAFAGRCARVVLQPTASPTLARQRLKSLPCGGATPFADGLVKAWRLIIVERLKDPFIQPLMVVISDGEANVAYDADQSYADLSQELRLICGKIGQDRIHAIVIDTKPRREGSGNMLAVAGALNGTYHHIDGLKAKNVVAAVTAHPFRHAPDG
jgi:magnesium chelatase subunit D